MSKHSRKTDEQIQKDVVSELEGDPRVTATEISVTAKNGVVTLRGSVPHYFEKNSAEEIAPRIAGVRAIADELKVTLEVSHERSDQSIAAAASAALEWNYAVPEGVRITVDNGWVNLRGEAEFDFQRDAARDAIIPLLGVRGVSNQITLKTKIEATEVKARIEDVLKRSAEGEGRRIIVTVEGDGVTLSGNVHSFAEFEDAKFAALCAPGVKHVKNNLRIAA